MSQIYKNQGGSPAPDIETLTGDTGTNPVSPDGAFNINLFGDPLAPGITTRGDAASNTVFFGLDLPIQCGTGQSVDVGTADLITLDLGATAATYTLYALVGGKAATASGIGGSLTGSFRTTGAAATLINTVDVIVNRDLVIAGASFIFVASGNNVILRATGSLGSVINWNACMLYLTVTGGI